MAQDTETKPGRPTTRSGRLRAAADRAKEQAAEARERAREAEKRAARAAAKAAWAETKAAQRERRMALQAAGIAFAQMWRMTPEGSRGKMWAWIEAASGLSDRTKALCRAVLIDQTIDISDHSLPRKAKAKT